MPSTWYSIYDFSFDYKGIEPSFIKPDEFDWASELKANGPLIKDELFKYLSKHDLKSYFASSMVSRNNSWRTISLKTWSIELFKNQKEFPITNALIKKYPQIISASFNLLEPNSKILPHCGDTNAIYRCHLGLEIPEGLPNCGFRVRDENRAWENNEWIIFMDAYNHEAFNNSTKERYIFLLDVLRDEFSSQKKQVCATVLSSLFIQKLTGRLHLDLTKYPFFVKVIIKLLVPFARISVYLVNLFKWF
jgi:aspartyl/asparaginyl beta-hydroxylase (cupin superfamily)